jgi:hypothetical protein
MWAYDHLLVKELVALNGAFDISKIRIEFHQVQQWF